MIVNCQLPAGKSKVAYGAGALGVNDDNTVDIPQYVAKTLVAAGATCADPLAGTVAGLLAASSSAEQQYIFWSYNKSPGTPTEANALFAERGEPAVSFT